MSFLVTTTQWNNGNGITVLVIWSPQQCDYAIVMATLSEPLGMYSFQTPAIHTMWLMANLDPGAHLRGWLSHGCISSNLLPSVKRQLVPGWEHAAVMTVCLSCWTHADIIIE